jgi:hypothetical protein
MPCNSPTHRPKNRFGGIPGSLALVLALEVDSNLWCSRSKSLNLLSTLQAAPRNSTSTVYTTKPWSAFRKDLTSAAMRSMPLLPPLLPLLLPSSSLGG